MSRRTSAALAVVGLFAAKGCFVVLDYSEYEAGGQGGAGGTSGPGGGQGAQGGGGGSGGTGGAPCPGGPQPEVAGNGADEDCNGDVCAPPGWTVRSPSSLEYAVLSGIAVDDQVAAEDGVFVAGSFRGVLELGPNPVAQGEDTVWIAKLNRTDGSVAWLSWPGAVGETNPWGTSSRAHDVAAGGPNYVYLTGSLGAVGAAGERGFVNARQINSGESAPHFRTFSAPQGARGSAAGADGSGVYVAGSAVGNLDVSDSGACIDGSGSGEMTCGDCTARGGRDIVVIRYGSLGACKSTGAWGRLYGGPGDDEALDLALGSDGNVVVTGSYRGALLGADPPDAGMFSDILVMKVSGVDGSEIWSAGFVSSTDTHDARGRAVAVDGDRNIVITGEFFGVTTFGSSPLQSVGPDTSDAFVAKLDEFGAVSWARRFGGVGDDIGTDVAVDAAGGIHVTGVFSGTIDLGSAGQLVAQGDQDLFFLKLDSAGNVVCSGRFAQGGTAVPEQRGRLAVSSSGQIQLAGTWGVGELDFGAMPKDATSPGLELFVNVFGPLP